MLPDMLRHADAIFKEPLRARVITTRVDNKYKAAPSGPLFIRSQMPPDSIVATTACKRANSPATGDMPPPEKESKRIYGSGKRVAAQAANH